MKPRKSTAANPAAFDVSTITISNDPFVGRLRTTGSKYDEVFGQLKIGQRLVCHPEAAARLSTQLRGWLEKRGHKNPVVRSVTTYHDGKGGVWWLEGEAKPSKPKTTWIDVAKKRA